MNARNWTVLLLFILLLGIGAHATPPKVQYQADLVPAYGGSYSQTDDLLKQLLDEVKGLRKDVQSLKTGGQASGELSVASLTGKHCIACHGAAVADEKGNGFVMVEKDSTLTEFSVSEKRRIARMVEQGKMPPPPAKLTDEEKKVFQSLKP